MKIAITSKEPSLASGVSSRFAGSKYWIMYDTCDKSFEVFTNRGDSSKHFGSPRAIINKLTNKNIDIVVSGYINPKTLNALNDTNIKHFKCRDDSISNVIETIEKKFNKNGNNCTVEISELQLLR